MSQKEIEHKRGRSLEIRATLADNGKVLSHMKSKRQARKIINGPRKGNIGSTHGHPATSADNVFRVSFCLLDSSF